VIPVCPEVAGGLPTPRIPCEIVNGVVTNKNGESKDKEFRSGAKQVYDGSFSGKLIEGRGVFAQLLGDNGIKVLDLEDLYK
jgi:uncharacterized protein YbbK (DUF523 family)